MGKSKKNRKEKEKIIYVDDGRTIADMTGVGSMGRIGKDEGKGKKASSKPVANAPRRHASFGEQWQTYWQAVRLMFFPMLVVLGIIAVAFLIVYVLL